MHAHGSGLEVHTHSRVTHDPGSFNIRHSHPDPLQQHPGHGPARFDICRECWAESTGLRGGGRKQFTVRPSGVQL